jgi:ketosteroid isomerase-like protein
MASPPPPPSRSSEGSGAGQARAAADRYVEFVNAGDLDGLASLFADGAVLDHSLGIFEGRAAIAGFYGDVIVVAAPVVTVVAVSAERAGTCVMELEGTVAEHVSHTVDVFAVDEDGLIERLEIRMG